VERPPKPAEDCDPRIERPAGSAGGARVAVALYAGVAAAMCGSWILLYAYLGRHPELLDQAAESTYVTHGRLRSWAGAVAYLLAGAVGVLVSPVIALVVFIALPVFYFMTSEGLPGRS
jgi:hypothetical protein